MLVRNYYDATGEGIRPGASVTSGAYTPTPYPSKRNLMGVNSQTRFNYIDPWTRGKREWRQPKKKTRQGAGSDYVNPITGGQVSSLIQPLQGEPVHSEPETGILGKVSGALDKPAEAILGRAGKNRGILEEHGVLGKAISIPYSYAMGALYGIASLVSPKAWKNTGKTLVDRFKTGRLFPDLTKKPEIGSPSSLAFTLGSITGPLLLGEAFSKPPDYVAPDTATTIAEARETGLVGGFKVYDYGGIGKAAGYFRAGSREGSFIESRLAAVEADKLLWVREHLERGPVEEVKYDVNPPG